jgi:hypothetical protein
MNKWFTRDGSNNTRVKAEKTAENKKMSKLLVFAKYTHINNNKTNRMKAECTTVKIEDRK